jgi:hypothetical protein
VRDLAAHSHSTRAGVTRRDESCPRSTSSLVVLRRSHLRTTTTAVVNAGAASPYDDEASRLLASGTRASTSLLGVSSKAVRLSRQLRIVYSGIVYSGGSPWVSCLIIVHYRALN